MDKIGGKTLQEIQDMPRSKMLGHMRKHVDHRWGRDKGAIVYEVTFTHTDTMSVDIKADSKEEAKELLPTMIGGSVDVNFVSAELVELKDG
jgi:hypothetical protein